MKIKIHRGANQIGGCITEISTEGCKILIDFGSNLPGNNKDELTEEQVKAISCDADAVFYTHYHGDHVGLHHLIPKNVEQYIGHGAKEVMLCKYNALKNHIDCSTELEATHNMLCYDIMKTIDVRNKGKIKVTPLFTSHSAFDAYMFVIECEGKRILHTGDFREHGYLGKGLFPMLEKFVHNIDILITEGTMLGRKKELVLSEEDIKQNIINEAKKHKYLFVLCSSTDIDRLSSLYSACKIAKREFFVDVYQASVLDVFTKFAGKKTNAYKFDYFKLINYRTENVRRHMMNYGFIMPIRTSSTDLLTGMMSVYNDDKPWLIYSMWSGYAEEGKESTNSDVINIRKIFHERILDGTKDGFHTSGHADVKTLEKLCRQVNPRLGVIPIHKDTESDYSSLNGVNEYKIFNEGQEIIENIIIDIQ